MAAAGWRFPATLRRPTRYLNPGVPDGERQLAWRGTPLVGSVKSGRLIELLARGGVIDEALATARAAVRRAVASSVGAYSERSAAVVLAILIGDRAGLTDEVERRLQEAGTYHVIAISGGNIAIVAGLCVFLLPCAQGWSRTVAPLVVAVLSCLRARRRRRTFSRTRDADGGRSILRPGVGSPDDRH